MAASFRTFFCIALRQCLGLAKATAVLTCFSQNRKLRALQGISLRNLTLSRPATTRRGHAIDDESLPNSLRSPAKAVAQLEHQTLEHSKSSIDLRLPSSSDLGGETMPNDDASLRDPASEAQTKSRPQRVKIRRRSTLNWTNASPRLRQQQLEEITSQRMADTWISLHCSGIPEPIYVSEVMEKSMNPSFRFFDLNTYGPAVTRQDELTIKCWTRTERAHKYILLVELRVNLRSLQFIGKTLESFHHPLPGNSVLFHLTDGIYTSFTDLPLDEPFVAPHKVAETGHQPESTSSFDALMRLSNLDDCIQDALSTREKLTAQISNLLEHQKASRDIVNQASQAENQLISTEAALSRCRKEVRTTQTRRSDLQASLESRREAIRSGKAIQQSAEPRLALSKATLLDLVTKSNATKTALSGQTRRICEDLLNIYPIESIDPKSLSYSICGLHLPNANTTSTHPDTDSDTIAAALGLVAHITQMLSLYLSIPLPYPPSPHGSTSTIHDPISTTMPSLAARTFPLYQKGAVAYRFEYAVFLLNTNIELLMSRQGAKVVDLRHTLPNLKYVLTVLTAGKGELPVRKKGGVKALQNGKAIRGQNTVDEVDAAEKVSHTNGTALKCI